MFNIPSRFGRFLITYFRDSSILAARICFSIFFPLFLCFFSTAVSSADTIVHAVRVGPTPDYTRITLESNQPLHYELSMLDNPSRVVIDLNNSILTPELSSLPQKINASDPFIQKVRIGQFKPQTIRLVFDLKINVVPRTFVIEPKENFGYRLVMDIYHPSKAAETDSDAKKLDKLFASLANKEVKTGQKVPTISQSVIQKPIPSPIAKHKKPAPPRMIVVAIDAGHGGKDPGAVGYKGNYEKDITLSIARKLKEKIDKEPNMRAVLTRTGDYYLSLPQRRINARRANADLFVSIHADANPKSHARGSSVFTLSEHGATSTTASWLAKKENSVDGDLIGGIDITKKSIGMKELLLDLSLNATINDSVKLAEHVLKEIGDFNHLHKKNVEQAGFAVLKSPDIPSILVETAFLSNPGDEEKLISNHYQNKMADALLSGIKRYFSTNPALARTEMALAD